MAGPSEIPNHPLVQMLDYEGDAFPTGSSYFIKNLCSNFYQALAFNHSMPSAVTCTAQQDPDCKWLIQYENNDRSKIALRSARTGRYLAATSADCRAPMTLSDQMVWWYVYQGGAPGTYWLGSSQTKDCFLHTWDCSQGEASLVASFTNRDPKWSSFYNAPYTMFEQWSTGMSWGLDPTPELRQWKEQQKASPQAQSSQQDLEGSKQREQALADKERQMQEREADLQQRGHQCSKREQQIAAKLQTISTGEQNLKEREQAFDTKSQDFEKSYDELKKREEAVQAAEERVKKSKKGGKAQLLATQEEKDSLRAELKNLQEQLGAATEEIAQLKQQVQQREHVQGQQAGDSSRVSSKNCPHTFSIRSPQHKTPAQKLPAIKLPERKEVESRRPAQALPSGYNAGMMKRFEAGRKAMSMKA